MARGTGRDEIWNLGAAKGRAGTASQSRDWGAEVGRLRMDQPCREPGGEVRAEEERGLGGLGERMGTQAATAARHAGRAAGRVLPRCLRRSPCGLWMSPGAAGRKSNAFQTWDVLCGPRGGWMLPRFCSLLAFSCCSAPTRLASLWNLRSHIRSVTWAAPPRSPAWLLPRPRVPVRLQPPLHAPALTPLSGACVMVLALPGIRVRP